MIEINFECDETLWEITFDLGPSPVTAKLWLSEYIEPRLMLNCSVSVADLDALSEVMGVAIEAATAIENERSKFGVSLDVAIERYRDKYREYIAEEN